MCCCLLAWLWSLYVLLVFWILYGERREGWIQWKKKMAMYNVRKIRTSILQKVVPNVFIWGEKGGWEEGWKKNGHVQPVSNSYCDSTESCAGLFRTWRESLGSVPHLVSHSILQSRVYGSLPNPAWIFTANHARQPGHATRRCGLWEVRSGLWWDGIVMGWGRVG